jgi:phosphomannomutase
MIFITRTKILKIQGTEPQFHLYVEVKSEPELEYIFSKIKEIITKHKPAGNCH